MKPSLPLAVVRSHADLFALWDGLVGRGDFTTTSVWLVFLDEHNRVQPVVVPIDGIPPEPDVGFLRGLARIVAGLVDGGDAASVAMLISRPGSSTMTESDRRWARALRSEVGDELAAWPIHLATSGRIRVFAPDDLLVGS